MFIIICRSYTFIYIPSFLFQMFYLIYQQTEIYIMYIQMYDLLTNNKKQNSCSPKYTCIYIYISAKYKPRNNLRYIHIHNIQTKQDNQPQKSIYKYIFVNLYVHISYNIFCIHIYICIYKYHQQIVEMYIYRSRLGYCLYVLLPLQLHPPLACQRSCLKLYIYTYTCKKMKQTYIYI